MVRHSWEIDPDAARSGVTIERCKRGCGTTRRPAGAVGERNGQRHECVRAEGGGLWTVERPECVRAGGEAVS